MKAIHDMLEEIQAINLDDEIEQSLYDTRENYVSLQQQQIKSGVRSDGKNIFRLSTGSDEYSPAYAKKKGKSKPIDLYDTGNFSRGIFVDIRDQELFIDSAATLSTGDFVKESDSISDILQKDYGEEIFGLDDDRGQDFADVAGQVLVERVQKKLS